VIGASPPVVKSSDNWVNITLGMVDDQRRGVAMYIDLFLNKSPRLIINVDIEGNFCFSQTVPMNITLSSQHYVTNGPGFTEILLYQGAVPTRTNYYGAVEIYGELTPIMAIIVPQGVYVACSDGSPALHHYLVSIPGGYPVLDIIELSGRVPVTCSVNAQYNYLGYLVALILGISTAAASLLVMFTLQFRKNLD